MKNLKILALAGIIAGGLNVGMAFAQQATTTAASLPAIARFSGIVSNAGPNGFTLTNGNNRSVSVNAATGATVLVNEQPAAFSVLANGMQAGVYGVWSGGTTTVSASFINADSASASGVVSNANGSGFTLTSGAHAIMVAAGANAVISIDRQAGSISSIRNGMTAAVYGGWTSPAKSAISASVITSSHAGASGKIGQTSAGQFIVVNGSGKQITVNVGGNTIISKGGAPSSQAAILDGAPVAAYGFWTDPAESALNADSIFLYGNGIEASSTTGWCHTFYQSLRIGSNGSDVSSLQTALNQSGFAVQETGSFDQSTAAAVTGFQEKYASEILTPNGLTYGTGYVGPSTKTKLNALYGCANPINPIGSGDSRGNDGSHGQGSDDGNGWQQ